MGTVFLGGEANATVTVKLQELELPDTSVEEQVTVVAPSGKVEPESGAQSNVAMPHASEALAI